MLPGNQSSTQSHNSNAPTMRQASSLYALPVNIYMHTKLAFVGERDMFYIIIHIERALIYIVRTILVIIMLSVLQSNYPYSYYNVLCTYYHY